MVWPIGQPEGSTLELAMRSRKIWQEAGAAARFRVCSWGSLHLARHEDGLAVLEEFISLAAGDRILELGTPDKVISPSPGARREGLLAPVTTHQPGNSPETTQ